MLPKKVFGCAAMEIVTPNGDDLFVSLKPRNKSLRYLAAAAEDMGLVRACMVVVPVVVVVVVVLPPPPPQPCNNRVMLFPKPMNTRLLTNVIMSNQRTVNQ